MSQRAINASVARSPRDINPSDLAPGACLPSGQLEPRAAGERDGLQRELAFARAEENTVKSSFRRDQSSVVLRPRKQARQGRVGIIIVVGAHNE
jgi:hypothetical protein